MSPTLHTRPLRLSLCAGIAMLAGLMQSHVQGQISGGDQPFMESGSGTVNLGTTPLRLSHRSRGPGEETSETAFGANGAIPWDGGVFNINGQIRTGNSDQDLSVNFGLGNRWMTDDFITGNQQILGAWVWYDGEDTKLDNYFNQIGLSFERLGQYLDLRLNANIPLEDTKTGSTTTTSSTPFFFQNLLALETLTQADTPLRIVDFEVAPRIGEFNAWGYGGGYQMDGDNISDFGWKAGVRGYVYNDLVLDVGVNKDNTFGTNTVVQVIWTPGRTTPGMSRWMHDIEDRYREQVYRNAYVATKQTNVVGAQALTDASGDDIRVVHVASNAAAGGDGTIEHPLNAISDINAHSQAGDIVLVHSTSTFAGQTATIQSEQRFLGEGGNQEHTVVTQQQGTINLPASSPGAKALAVPIINGPAGSDAVVLSDVTTDHASLTAMEVSNFQINGGARGIVSAANGVAAVNINHVDITGTTGNAIDLKPVVETLADSTKRVRFSPTINTVTFNDVTGDDIHLDATTSEPTTTPITEAIAVSNYKSGVSAAGDGVGINLINTKRAVALSNIEWHGGTSAIGGLRIKDAGGQSIVTMGGTNSFTGGKTTAPNTQGYAIRVESSAANHVVTGTTITNTGGDSVQIDGGSAGLAFTGRIDQANNASVLSVSNGHTGTASFTELTAGAGVINATNGDGLQFDNADGVYNFNDTVNLNGGDAGIDIVGGSAATLRFDDARITTPTGIAVNVDGGTASMQFTGRIDQTNNLNNAAAVNVQGGHTGTLTFTEITANQGVVNANSGTGLQFNNADGAYTFNDNVNLHGGDAGLDIVAGSAGTFVFSDLDITDPSGTAVNITGSSAVVTMSGDIKSDNAVAFNIATNTGGSNTINNTIDSTRGIRSNANTGGSTRFLGAVTLNTTTNDAVTILNNTGGSTRFDNIKINTTTGRGFIADSAATGHTVEVSGSTNTIATGAATALQLDTVAVGSAGVNFQKVSSTNATSGIVLNTVTGGTVAIGAGTANNGDGGTIAGSTGSGVSINNVASVTLNHMNITGSGDDGVSIDHTGSAASRVVISNTGINGSAHLGIDYNRTASGTSTLGLIGNTIDSTAGEEGVRVAIAGSGTTNLTVSGGNTITAGDESALLVNVTGGSAKTLNMLVDGNTSIANNDATEKAAVFNFAGTGTFNSTVTSNVFSNGGAVTGQGFEMTANSPSAVVRLNLDGNTSLGPNADQFVLNETSGTFTIQDVTTVQTRNNGTIDFNPNIGAFGNDAGPIPTPPSPP